MFRYMCDVGGSLFTTNSRDELKNDRSGKELDTSLSDDNEIANDAAPQASDLTRSNLLEVCN